MAAEGKSQKVQHQKAGALTSSEQHQRHHSQLAPRCICSPGAKALCECCREVIKHPLGNVNPHSTPVFVLFALPQVRAQALRECYREAAKNIRSNEGSYQSDMERLRNIFPQQALTDDGNSVDLPFTTDGLKMAILNAET